MPSEINYSYLPSHMREGARRYIEKGIIPGEFLAYIFANDFVHAAAHADEINKSRLYDYAKFLYFEAPIGCWGSLDKMKAWAVERIKERT